MKLHKKNFRSNFYSQAVLDSITNHIWPAGRLLRTPAIYYEASQGIVIPTLHDRAVAKFNELRRVLSDRVYCQRRVLSDRALHVEHKRCHQKKRSYSD